MSTALCWEGSAPGTRSSALPSTAPLGNSFIWFLSWIFYNKTVYPKHRASLSFVSFSQISNTRGFIGTPAFAVGWAGVWVPQDPTHIHVASAVGAVAWDWALTLSLP